MIRDYFTLRIKEVEERNVFYKKMTYIKRCRQEDTLANKDMGGLPKLKYKIATIGCAIDWEIGKKRQREKDKQRQGERKRGREIETERQTNTQIDRQTGRERRGERKRERERERERENEREREMDGWRWKGGRG